MNLTKQEKELVIQLIENEIKSNKDYINCLNNKDKAYWKMINTEFKNILNKFEKKESQLVIQELTPAQEDYLIESEMERIREAKYE